MAAGPWKVTKNFFLFERSTPVWVFGGSVSVGRKNLPRVLRGRYPVCMGVLTSPVSVMRSRQLQRLRKVADVQARLKRTEKELFEAVRAAREVEASWTDIGKSLGVTQQSAWRKFS